MRSKIGNGDIGAAVENAIRDANLSHYAEMAAENVRWAMAEYTLPSVMLRPKVFIDGSHWCALYGDNLQDGVAGFGDSPAKAMSEFDRAWLTPLTPNVSLEGRSASKQSLLAERPSRSNCYATDCIPLFGPCSTGKLLFSPHRRSRVQARHRQQIRPS